MEVTGCERGKGGRKQWEEALPILREEALPILRCRLSLRGEKVPGVCRLRPAQVLLKSCSSRCNPLCSEVIFIAFCPPSL